MELQDRKYQDDVIDGIRRSMKAGYERVLLQAGTGSGKTVMAARLMQSAVEKGRHVLFVAHRRELIGQCSRKLDAYNVPHGIILAGEYPDHRQPVQVASIQTLESRYLRDRDKKENELFEKPLPPADLIVYDECHVGLDAQGRLLKAYPEAKVIGLTATPVRSDGRGLGLLYQDMVCAPGIEELTEMGYLVPLRYYAPSIPDLKGVKITAGDYNEKQLADRMDQSELVGDLVENWQRIAEGRKTIVFATSVRHSLHVRDSFNAAGIPAGHIDGETPVEEREATLKALREGRITVLSNCQVLCEGWDEPSVSCCILARPTKSVALYLQMAGRILRPDPSSGKEDAILIDHSGSVYEHGKITEFVDWDLDPNGRLQDRQAKRRQAARKPKACKKCKYVFEKGKRCPKCGWEIPVKPKEAEAVDVKDGQLQEITGRTGKKQIFTPADKARWFAELKGYAQEHGYADGWAAHAFREKFKEWPLKNSNEASTPSDDTLRFVKHLNIKRAMANRKKGQAARG